MQAAINAARGYLPANLPEQPDLPQGQSGRCPHPDPGADLRHASTRARCTTRPPPSCQQKLSQVEGVGQVFVGGSSLPAVRVELNPMALNKYGHRPRGRARVLQAHERQPAQGAARGRRPDAGRSRPTTSSVTADEYQAAGRRLPERGSRAAVGRGRRARIRWKTCARRGWSNGKPAVLVIIFRQPGANIIETVDRVRALLPQLEASIPRAIKLCGRRGPDADHPRFAAGRRESPWSSRRCS